ncbi:MAG: hypothetical protein EPO24_16255 [Bacteroidetes bacterium]|nr:MAG: hypothetical protein EPO24_16255 [Bacteroidota bacterium]
MKYITLFFLFLFFHGGSASSQITSSIYFLDRFSTYKNGSDGSPIWTPVKGSWQVVNESYMQRAPDYDCASMYNVFLNESFEVEITFKHISGDVGAGLFFSSYERSSTSYAQMVRFDGSSVFLLGYFAGGEFTATTSVKVDSFDVRAQHTLSLKVDREHDNYTVKLDGAILKANEPLVYRSGYCGLQSSAGEIQFTKFRLSRVEPGILPFDLTWTKNFSITAKHQFIVPDEIRGTIKVLLPDSNSSVTIGSPVSEHGQLLQPVATAMLDTNTIVVADRGTHRLVLFGTDGGWRGAAGWKGKERGTFDGISGIAVNNSKQIFVLEETNHRVQVFDESLKVITEFGKDKLSKPLGIAVEESTVYIVNTGNCQIEQYLWDGKKATWKGFFSYGGGEGRGIAVNNGKVYVSVLNQVRQYDSSGTLLNSFSGRVINFITPWGMALDTSGNVYVSDFTGGRIVQLPSSINDVTPTVSFKTDGNATVAWTTIQKTIGTVIVTLNGDTVGTFKEAKPVTNHKVPLKKLAAGTTYRYHISMPVWTMPSRTTSSRFFSFRTPAASKTKQYSRLPMATIIFANVTDEKLLKSGDNSVPALPENEIERIKNQIRDGVKFYWIHSRFNYFLDNEFIVINQPFKRAQLYGSEWWYPPLDSMLETILKQNGKDIKNYSGILYLTCTQQYDTTLKNYVLAGKGGAFTNGVGTGKGYGISWWDVTRANHNAGNNWLLVHEYNHQLDDMFMMSGYPEYWFNHISPTIGTAADFGEHFDANRHILNIVPNEEWLDLKFTTIETTSDNDYDGIPDNDSRLPLDEARIGSDPKKADTDGDGVPDLNEIAFSSWLVEGWGETYGGKPIFPNVQSKDTDNDGVTDNEDAYPCFPFGLSLYHDVIPALNPLVTLKDAKIEATIWGLWDSTTFKFSLQTDKMVPIKLMLDGNTDGWFVGRDNFLINLIPKNDSTIETKLQLFNATDPQQWPFMDTTLAKMYAIKATYRKLNEKFLCDVQLPAKASFGLDWREGKKVGLLIGFLVPFDADGNKRYVNMFEPNKFFDVEFK